MDFLRHLYRVSVGLSINVHQDCRLPVCRDHRVNGFHARRNRGDIPDAHRNSGRSVLDHRIRDFFRCLYLAVDQAEIELMIALQKSWGVDKIGAPHGIQDVRYGYACRQQFGRIWRDVKFRLLSTLDQDCGDAVQPIQARLDLIGRHLPQPGLLYGVGGQAVANDGETGERQAVGFDFRARWKFGLRAR